MARKFIVKNRRKRKFMFTMLFILFFMIGIGYSNLSTTLNIGGNLGVSKFKCKVENKLYNVLKCAVEDGMARKYTQAHQDSMDASLSTEDVYYWYAASSSSGNTLANQIIEKNNVIFAGQCWQMLRTTDTGGVKMIYNGEVESGKCLNTRGTHVGYVEESRVSLTNRYWYGTEYTFDPVNKVFSISGTTERAVWRDTTYADLIGKYTCLGTTETATCSTLYLMRRYLSNTAGMAISLNANSHYSQLGTMPFNTNIESPAYVGYMYGDDYAIQRIDPIGTQNLSDIADVVDSRSTLTYSNTYLYSKNITYDGTNFSLVNPILGSAIPEDTYVGYYTTRSATNTSAASIDYLFGRSGTTGNSYYYANINSTYQNAAAYNMLIGDSLTDNGNGTYTVNNATLVTLTDWYANIQNYKEKYTCGDSTTTTCTNPRFLAVTSSLFYRYLLPTEMITFAKSRNGLNLLDTITVSEVDLYYNHSNYSDYKYTCNSTSTTCTEENLRMIWAFENIGYSYIANYYFGSDVSWNGTDYTLVNPIELESVKDLNNFKTHHYFCANPGLKTCSEIGYLFYSGSAPNGFYALMISGTTNIQSALTDMLKKNTASSTIKIAIDEWYRLNMLAYDEYIEDTIFCGDRTIRSLGAFNPNGGPIDIEYSKVEFEDGIFITCPNVEDRYSVSNNSAKLTYKIGLMSKPEMYLLINNNIRKNGNAYYLLTPISYHSSYYHSFESIRNDGSVDLTNGFIAQGVRPAISLRPGIEFSSGDGSTANPYVVKMD